MNQTLADLMARAGAQARSAGNAVTMGALPTLAAAPMYAYNRTVGAARGDPRMSWEDAYGSAQGVMQEDAQNYPTDVTIGELMTLAGGLAAPARQLASGAKRLSNKMLAREQMRTRRIPHEDGHRIRNFQEKGPLAGATEAQTEQARWLIGRKEQPQARAVQDELLEYVPNALHAPKNTLWRNVPDEMPPGMDPREWQQVLLNKQVVPGYVVKPATAPSVLKELSPGSHKADWVKLQLNRDAAQYAADLARQGYSKEYIIRQMNDVFGGSDNYVINALAFDDFASPEVRNAIWAELRKAGRK